MTPRLHFRLAEDLPTGHGHLHFGLHPNTLTAVAAAIAPAVVTAALATLGQVPPITAVATFVAPHAISHAHAYLWHRLRRDSKISYTNPVQEQARQAAIWSLPELVRKDKETAWSLPAREVGIGKAEWTLIERLYSDDAAEWGLFDVAERGSSSVWQRFLTSESVGRIIWTAPGPALWHSGRVVYDLAPGVERRGRVPWGLFARVVQPDSSKWDWAPLRIWQGEVRWSLARLQSWNGPVPIPRPIPPAPKPVPHGPGHLFFHLPHWPVPPSFQGRLHFGRRYSTARYGINMITDLSLVKLPNLEPIRFQSLTIEEAMDSHARLLRLIIRDRESYLLLQPDDDFNPAEVRATLNNYSWDFVVTDGDGGFSFGDIQFTVNAQSRIIYLGAPYAPSRDYSETNTRTAHQLADQEVENTGFEIVWDTADWLVPEGVFSYQNLTPLDALKRVTSAVGAYIRDDTIAPQVVVTPKYLIEPWLWSQQQPVTTISASQARSLTIQNLRHDDTNRVVVSGGNTGKVRVVAVRSGTAGDHSQALSSDSLICDIDAGAERTRQFFCAAGRHCDVVLSGIPLAPAPGDPKLLRLGDLVRVEWRDETPWIGMVTGVKINAQIGSLLMDVTLDHFLET
jgi:hypothetical protein